MKTIDKYGKGKAEARSFDPITGRHTIQLSYEARGNNEIDVVLDGVQVETVSASAITNRYDYNAYGQKSAAIDGRGNATLFEYDKFGNPYQEVVTVYQDQNGNTIKSVQQISNGSIQQEI